MRLGTIQASCANPNRCIMGHHNENWYRYKIFDQRGKLKEVFYKFFKVHDPLQAEATVLLDTLQYILTQTPMATHRAGDSNGDWQVVSRRKPFPNKWRHSQPSQPKATPYQPYSKPTYAQILLRSNSSPTMSLQDRNSPNSSQPPSPTSQSTTAYYVSPHSPSRLRFPPSHTFPEWKGRCFRCCRTGHSAAKCRNPKRCGRCWSYGHIGSKCRQNMVPPPTPPIKAPTTSSPNLHTEPNFDELLAGSYPYHTPEMPKERQPRVHCFIPRDTEYFTELERLKQGVVLHTGAFQWDLSVNNVCDYACRTNLVTREEIQVSELSGQRFLILLPAGLDPDTFINKTPQAAWDEGLSFQPWSPFDGASISIPAYKVLLSLVDVPPHLFREHHIAKAVSHFGVYLGSVAPENPSSLAALTAAVGVDDLTLIPNELVLHVGGLVHYTRVHVMNWQRDPLYKVEDMPAHPKTYTRPQPPPSSTSSSDTEMGLNDHDLIPMSTRVLRDLCRGRAAASLPPELRPFAAEDKMEIEASQKATHSTAQENPAATFQNPDSHVPLSYQRNLDDIQHTEHNVGAAGQSLILYNHGAATRSPSCPRESNTPATQDFMNLHDKLPTVEESPRVHMSYQAQGPRVIQPQRILHRGESSKKDLAAGKGSTDTAELALKGRTDGAELAQNPRPILSPKETPSFLALSNLALSTSAQHNPRVIQKAAGVAGRVKAPQAQKSQLINRAKGKSIRCGPLNIGPQPRKFKWTRPAPTNNAQLTKKIIAASGAKKKVQPDSRRAPTKKDKHQAEVSFNPDGFYEVQVHYDHISKLAAGCGFTPKDVDEVIRIDNEERRRANTHTSLPITTDSAEISDPSRFDPDSSDELTSDEEEA
ncbi:hypothetical protein FCM35_KLT17039 [Carex littledalei]|uniref:CCHC-type domain-containing protein n=1 Tax=Carex littledalei TaxID=544730 RepID=A0A833VFV5_9POAL|nr:hypothetical protein FCM35_KLT17039 [Carex littledalei]